MSVSSPWKLAGEMLPLRSKIYLNQYALPLIDKTNSSRNLTIFLTSCISSSEIIRLVIPDPDIFI